METFDNYIDEFVDWVTGEDTSSQEDIEKVRVSSTGGLPVSGGKIRELLQTRLKKPFVYYEDTNEGLYRMFSSESTKLKWIRMNNPNSPDYDPDGSKKLELFNFVRPTDLVLGFDGLTKGPFYVIKDTASNATQLLFGVTLRKGTDTNAPEESDAFTLTYTVKDSYGVDHVDVEERDPSYTNSSSRITKDISKYLTVGKNDVTVYAKAKNSSASNSINFSIYVIEFVLDSTFDYSAHWDPTKPIEVPVSVRRSDTSLELQVDIYIDRTANSPGIHAGSWTVNDPLTNPTKKFSLANTYASNETSLDHIKHTMMITAALYNQDTNQYYYSNVLFYDFIVASNAVGIANKFVTTKYDIAHNKVNIDEGTDRVILTGTQYEPLYLYWAYYTDRQNIGQSENIEWAIKSTEVVDGEDVVTYTSIARDEGQNNSGGKLFKFIPDFNTVGQDNIRLVALDNRSDIIDEFPLSISASTLSIAETGGYSLKLSAYGRNNYSPDRNSWTDSVNNITSTLTNIKFDENSGWSNDSFVTSGTDQYLTVNYNPLEQGYNLANNGKTIEIDFMPEKVSNDGDVVITIGDVERGHIVITTNEASLYNGTTQVVHTNYKAYERIKLAFIFNPVQFGSNDSDLIYIVNNGILERAAAYGTASAYLSGSGNIKIGGSESGIRVYSIRVYDKALNYEEALNNYIYDAEDRAEAINRNDILSSGIINYNKVKNKIDTIVIEGDLTNILSQGTLKDASSTTVNFRRECVTDASKSFEVLNGMIRKHGQSTLSYPITSLKIWTNKAKESNVSSVINLSDEQKSEGLNKNRYIMKDGSIPANKFVLQANYADSSGTHNGALLRLIQDTWYNANFGTRENPIYRLRTSPQLFASGYTLTHNNANLNEDGSWVEGTGVGKAVGKTWTDISSKPFPYIIRNAPDSFPCAVFYKNGPDDGYHFLGQYVFMDDKKSDYLYGERSIYHYGTDNDPFVLKTENTKNGPNGKLDTSANCVWDNKNVLRIEVVLPNTRLTSYMDFNITDSNNISHSCTDIKYNLDDEPEQYYWEDYFEMIYPDEDDVAEDDAKNGLDKFNPNSKFANKIRPFINFLKWITDCKNNYNKATDWWSAGTYSSTQQAFQATAHDHLDLYKLAAYYVFFLRFGLVDSVERNAQLKTYDGQHWHYEGWDMDIALGNTNQGALVLNPPMTRNTMEPGTTTYAYSGKSLTTSNVLWDCLEAWPYWSNTVVPEVAKALYDAGLNYDNIIKYFDNDYASAWSEAMYNQSGYFKYIENGGSDWLAWLLGSRESHRHWWISTSMNYYDAKWSCGSFEEHRIVIFADKSINQEGTDIVTIKPTSDTFFKITQQEGRTNLGFVAANRTTPAAFDISTTAFSAKDPSYIYGGTFVEEIDLSCFAEKLKAVDFSLCYDNILGAPIKKINVGVPYTITDATHYTGKVSGTGFRLTGDDPITGNDALSNLLVLDITGQSTITTTQEILGSKNRKAVTDFYAIGSGITEFISSTSGNNFNTIKLPGVTTTTYSGQPSTITAFNTLSMLNSSWDTIEFWDTTKSGSVEYVRDENDEIVYDDDNLPILVPNTATFTKSTIPSQLGTVQFRGSTARNECAGQFLLDWIDAIDNSLPYGHTEEDLYAVLRTKTFEAENINWGVDGQTISITYNDLARIAQFNGGLNQGGTIKGYIRISDAEPLTALQLSNITDWFGDGVFTLSSKNSGLVVDQATDYVRIVSTGTRTDGQDITLHEGQSATLVATKFMLSDEDQTSFTWSMIEGQVGSVSNGTAVKSASIAFGDDDLIHLTARTSGIYGDYYVTVCAQKQGFSPEYLTIKIIGAILPDHIDINTEQVAIAPARKFYLNDTLGTQESILTNKVKNAIDNSIRDSFVLTLVGQKVEFYPTVVDGETPSTVAISNIRYQVSPSLMPTLTPYTQLTGYEDNAANRVDDGILMYTKSATHNGIVLGVASLPSDMVLYELTINVSVADRSYIKTVNVLVYDDSIAMHLSSTSAVVHTALNAMHQTLYGDSLSEYYKSDLRSLTGTLDFSSQGSNLISILDVNGLSLFTHLSNINAIDLSGCNSLLTSSITTNNVFPSMSWLHSINITGCTNMSGVIDFSSCTNLNLFIAKNTTVGVIFGQNSQILTLELGGPTSIDISNPIQLTPNGVKVNAHGNIDSLILRNIPNASTYAVFERVFAGYNILRGGALYWGVYSDNGNGGSLTGGTPTDVPSRIYVANVGNVTPGHVITAVSVGQDFNFRIYAEDGTVLVSEGSSNCTWTNTVPNNGHYLIIDNGHRSGQMTELKVTDTTDNIVLFEYKA